MSEVAKKAEAEKEAGAFDVCEIAHGSPEYARMVDLRYRILREPLGLGFTPEQLAAETADTLIGAFAGETLVGCLVLSPRSATQTQMRQVAVEPAWQGQGVGRRLVGFSEQAARRDGAAEILLHARETAIDFYLRLNYVLIGEPFMEVGLPHHAMRKRLDDDDTER